MESIPPHFGQLVLPHPPEMPNIQERLEVHQHDEPAIIQLPHRHLLSASKMHLDAPLWLPLRGGPFLWEARSSNARGGSGLQAILPHRL